MLIMRQRKIGIRMALGARPANVVQRVTGTAIGVCLGLTLGSAGGMAARRLVQALLYDLKATDLGAPSLFRR